MIQKSIFKSKRSKIGRKVYFLKKIAFEYKKQNKLWGKKKEEKTNYFKSIFEKNLKITKIYKNLKN